jgi:signal transduction histidine kinase
VQVAGAIEVSPGWLGRHQRAGDVLPAAFLVACSVAAVAVSNGWAAGKATEIGWMAASCGPLAWRSRWPLPVTAVTLAMGVAYMVALPSFTLAPVACPVALYTLGTRAGRRAAWAAGLAAAAAITATYALVHPHVAVYAEPFIYFDLAVLATGLGVAVRDRRIRLAEAEARAERAERSRDEESRRRVAEERVRIARDLHDVVAHHITLVNAQASVAHHLMRSDPEAAYEMVGHLKDASRAALDELRATVGYLRRSGEESRAPLPNVEEVDVLAESFRAGGMSVDVVRLGPVRRAASSVEVAAYRIVSEALTNAHKHAAAARVLVTLEYRTDKLLITVADDGRPGAHGDGGGHGLIGMRERAAAVGGTVEAGPRRDGGFRVRAQLPLATGLAAP